jgi:hypothetical protein
MKKFLVPVAVLLILAGSAFSARAEVRIKVRFGGDSFCAPDSRPYCRSAYR